MKSESRLKRHARIIAGQSPPSSQVGDLDEHGLRFLQGNAEFTTTSPVPAHACDTAPKRARSGDILLSVRAPVGALNIADQPYGIGRGLCAIRSTRADQRFLWWALHHSIADLQSRATGSTYEAVSVEDVADTLIPTPPLTEQRAIADYLDIETGRINALISKKRRMIELLDERMLYAARALTTGRGDVAPLRRFARAVKTGTTPPGRELNALTAKEVPWYSPGDVGPYLRMRPPERMLSWQALSDRWTPLFPADSTVIVGIGTVGRVGHTATVSTGNQQMTCITPNTKVVPRFLSWQLWALADELRETAPHTTLPILNNDFLRSVSISVPPLDHQASIVTRLDRKADRVSAVSKRLRVQIELLAERRQALITKAVTGKSDTPACWHESREREGLRGAHHSMAG